MEFKTIDFSTTSTREIQQLLTSTVLPRPIAFASTVDAEGRPNLSPFSYFNAFGANPPLLVFSPARRGRDNTTKHTLENIREVPEVVINMVSYSMADQMSFSSADFPKGVNEFEKAGFTALESVSVRPFRVKESPVQFECEVIDVIETGNEGGAANLVLCKVKTLHISKAVLGENDLPDAALMDIIGRMGGEDYVRTGKAIFTLPKPSAKPGIGFDALPDFIRNSSYLTARELTMLASQERMPGEEDTKHYSDRSEPMEIAFEQASEMINDNNAWEALCYLMSFEKDFQK